MEIKINFDDKDLHDYIYMSSYAGFDEFDEFIKYLLDNAVENYFGNKEKLKLCKERDLD